MILVTVGNHYQDFSRLVKVMDQLACEIEERVVIQRGHTIYMPQYAEHFQWASSRRMEELTSEARVVIGHAGSGTIITTLKKNKPLILVPRLRRFREHGDDHQEQLARVMQAEENAIVIRNPTVSIMKDAIENAVVPKKKVEKPTRLIHAINQQLIEWELAKKK